MGDRAQQAQQTGADSLGRRPNAEGCQSRGGEACDERVDGRIGVGADEDRVRDEEVGLGGWGRERVRSVWVKRSCVA